VQIAVTGMENIGHLEAVLLTNRADGDKHLR
jgi:hypothetical protein